MYTQWKQALAVGPSVTTGESVTQSYDLVLPLVTLIKYHLDFILLAAFAAVRRGRRVRVTPTYRDKLRRNVSQATFSLIFSSEY